jgi:hypothetical protein
MPPLFYKAFFEITPRFNVTKQLKYVLYTLCGFKKFGKEIDKKKCVPCDSRLLLPPPLFSTFAQIGIFAAATTTTTNRRTIFSGFVRHTGLSAVSHWTRGVYCCRPNKTEEKLISITMFAF